MKKENKQNLLEDYHLLTYDVLDSTNEEAKRLAEGGASHGAVIWARRQTAGKGRMGREWVSEDGNLYVSVLLAPECRDMETAAQLSFVAGVAAVETITPMVPDETVSCKWPNDIMLGDRKVGGVLLEHFRTTAAETRDWVVVGVGINIENYPENTIVPATCIKEAGVEIISAKIVLSRFIYNFVKYYDLWKQKGFSPIRRLWLKQAYRKGEQVTVRLPKETCTGIFKGIDSGGMLELGLPGRRKKLVSAGDVFF